MKIKLIIILALLINTVQIEAKFQFNKKETNNTYPQKTKIKKDKKEENKKDKKTRTIEFNQVENDLDYACLSKMAEIQNEKTRKIDAVYYSVMHEIWRTNPQFKNVEEPNIKNIQNQLNLLCKNAFGKNKSFEFMLYKQSKELKLKEERFFEIINYFDNEKLKF